MLVSEAESANQADALILGTREAVADHDGAADDAGDTAFEDFRGAEFGAGRLLWRRSSMEKRGARSVKRVHEPRRETEPRERKSSVREERRRRKKNEEFSGNPPSKNAPTFHTKI